MRLVASLGGLAIVLVVLAATASGRTGIYRSFEGKVAHRWQLTFTVKVRNGRIIKVKYFNFVSVRCGKQRVTGFNEGAVRVNKQRRFKLGIPAENFSAAVRGRFGKRWKRATGVLHLGEICNTCEPADCTRLWAAHVS